MCHYSAHPLICYFAPTLSLAAPHGQKCAKALCLNLALRARSRVCAPLTCTPSLHLTEKKGLLDFHLTGYVFSLFYPFGGPWRHLASLRGAPGSPRQPQAATGWWRSGAAKVQEAALQANCPPSLSSRPHSGDSPMQREHTACLYLFHPNHPRSSCVSSTNGTTRT